MAGNTDDEGGDLGGADLQTAVRHFADLGWSEDMIAKRIGKPKRLISRILNPPEMKTAKRLDGFDTKSFNAGMKQAWDLARGFQVKPMQSGKEVQVMICAVIRNSMRKN